MLTRPTQLLAALLLCTPSLVGCAHSVAQAPSRNSAAARVTVPRRLGSAFSYEWFVRAELEFARGHYDAAVEGYRTALADADEDAYLFARLALALDRGGHADQASAALRDGLALDPDSEAVWLARGDIAQRHGALDQAVLAYERAIAAAPQSPDAPIALATLLRGHDQTGRAVAVLERFAAGCPAGGSLALHARLALALLRDDGEELANAARSFQDQRGGDAALIRTTARELAAQGRPALAARILAVLPVTDDDVRLRLQLSLALADHAQVEMLLATTQPVLLGGPLEIADAYLQIGRPANALDAVDQQDTAIDTDPHRRALLRAEALIQLGRPAQAALLLAKIPRGSKFGARALQALHDALDASALSALAQEVAPEPPK